MGKTEGSGVGNQRGDESNARQKIQHFANCLAFMFPDDPRETAIQQGQVAMDRLGLQPKSALTVPILEQEQQIDPWSVHSGKDSQGNALAFDYVAIAK
jgi:hypothetical protein